MTIRAPFQPQRGANQVLSATTTAASGSLNPQAKSVRCCVVTGGNPVHVRIGAGAQTATAADSPVLPGTCVVFQKGDGDDTLSCVTASGTATLHAQTGEGGQ